MKVLLANNFHYIRGGAERAYFDLGKILRDKGHEIAYFSTVHEKNLETKWSSYFVPANDLNKSHNPLTSLKIAFGYPYNFSAKKRLEKLIKDFNPDIVHLHNIHYLSPSVIDAAKKHNVPVVMTLHDYKPICPERTMYVRGQIWEASKKTKYYRCFLDKCIKNSYLKSLLATIEAYLHRFLKTYEKVDAFISPSKFLRDKFKEFGFKKDIAVLPNPLVDIDFFPEEESKLKDYLLYFGRLTEEKGVADIIRAYSKIKTETKLLIVGDGPQKEDLVNIAKKANVSQKVVFISRKSGGELKTLIKGARAVIFSSRWYENYPYSILEPMMLTKILICAKLGGIPEIVKNSQNGLTYEPGNMASLREKIQYVLENEREAELLGKEAKRSVLEINDKDKYYNNLMAIYSKLIKKEEK